MFTKNVGTADKTVRLIVGLALIGLALTQVIGWWGWIGVVPVATALFNFCPMYRLIGVKTCKVTGQ
ncbi:MAG: DUF2892 domain-containing protein [Natronospirillum sp.]|uniref:YgaP family membrane protein n=1 Tax=Natronospirillum sp. TaxID=2812955 RepID=UPI0025FCD91B|nr:DUF2892 domain-containing protein [Natronospirillum sp.]MCH8550288.1 DUF2892 domain-containing protein [Natronospirillum sp.]